MKTKLKDILLYSFAAIGVGSLFIAATNSPQQTISTVPESHVLEMHLEISATNGLSHAFSINKITGEVMQHSTASRTWNSKKNNTEFATYRVSKEIQ